LESLDGRSGGGAEDAVGVDGHARKDRRQPVLDVGNGLPLVARREGQDQR
jgi:hypothetical protein